LLEKKRSREAAKLASESNSARFAGELYRDYLKVALKYPHLSIAEFDRNNKFDSDQYDTFISIMLYSFDEMLKVSPNQQEWASVLNYQIEVHELYIREILSKNSDGGFRGTYNELLLDLIDKKLDKLSQAKNQDRKEH
jgi:hypothetical protein